MEDIHELTSYSARKASLISLQNESRGEKEKEQDKEAPPDGWNICYGIFFFYGLFASMVLPFIVNAQDYWLYKFRDTAQDHVDNNNRTTLQANFLSSLSLAAIPSTLTAILVARYGHKLHMRTRLIGSVFLCLITFIITTAFVKLNTDSWQFGFFLMTLTIAAGAMALNQVFNVSQMGLIGRFPGKYLKAQMYGQSLGGILSSLLQIIALSIGKDSQSKALIYFISGCVVISLTLVLTYLSRFSPCYLHYEGDATADTKRATHSIQEYKVILKKIWAIMAIQINTMIGMGMSFPTIANLVISEYYGQGSDWFDIYFPIVITYLMPEFLAISAKYFASPLMTPKNAMWWAIAQFLFMYGTAPLFLFCNAQPRYHLPVLLNHDWEYIILMFGTAVIRTYFLSVSYMSMENLAQEDTEAGFLISTSIAQLAGSVFSPLHSVYVNIL